MQNPYVSKQAFCGSKFEAGVCEYVIGYIVCGLQKKWHDFTVSLKAPEGEAEISCLVFLVFTNIDEIIKMHLRTQSPCVSNVQHF